MVTIIERNTGNVMNFNTRKSVMVNMLAPVMDEFSTISHTFNGIVEKYKDAELVKYEPTRYDMKRMAEDPEYVLDMPRYHVPGFDKEVTGTIFEQKIRNEFYERWISEDHELYKFINEYHPDFKVVIK